MKLLKCALVRPDLADLRASWRFGRLVCFDLQGFPRKIAAYTYHLNNTSRITDAPTIRSLGFALQDEFEDWRDGEMLIQSLLDTPEKVERASRRQQELEVLCLASGGIAGPGSLGEPVQEVAVA